jgi:hypothetical protein
MSGAVDILGVGVESMSDYYDDTPFPFQNGVIVHVRGHRQVRYRVVGPNPIRPNETFVTQGDGPFVTQGDGLDAKSLPTEKLVLLVPPLVYVAIEAKPPNKRNHVVFYGNVPRKSLDLWSTFTIVYADGTSRRVTSENMAADIDVVFSGSGE